MEAPRGAREPTGTNGPTLNNTTLANTAKGWQGKQATLPQPLYKSRSTHTPPNTQHGGMVLNTSLVVVIAPGKRPATFRTWKLSPAAPMVLQPTGCGRVGHRHNTPQASGQEPNGSWPLCFHTPTTPTARSTPGSRPGSKTLQPLPHPHQPQRQISHRMRTTPSGLDKQQPHK